MLLFLLLLNFTFILLARQGNREWNTSHLLVHSTNLLKSQSRVRLKSETQHSTCLSHMCARDPSTWAIMCYLPGCALAGGGITSTTGTQLRNSNMAAGIPIIIIMPNTRRPRSSSSSPSEVSGQRRRMRFWWENVYLNGSKLRMGG